MFGSNLLDVAIGLVFVYLLVSLVCSAANEIIEGWLKNRSTDLERGIRELFGLDPNEKAPAMMVALYNNPMISGLFKGSYGDEAKGIWQRLLAWLRKGPNLPSYIPARNFALALMDVATLPAGASSPPAGTSSSISGKASSTSGAMGATPPTSPANVSITLTAIPPAPPAPGQPGNRLTDLRNGVVANPVLPDQVKKALFTLIDAAGNDVAKARENIESWFNSSMDRVSGWYKRRTQVIILVLGFGLAAVFNIDTIVVAQRLATDKSLRESLVAAAGEYAKANAAAAASPSPAPAASPSTTSTAPPSTSRAGTPTATSPSVPTAEDEFTASYDKLEKLGLPIGWDTDESRTLVAHGLWTNKRAWTRKLLGWIITALAVSLGAPFWFDMLNKLIVVRSTVKPHEKSPEEPAKQ